MGMCKFGANFFGEQCDTSGCYINGHHFYGLSVSPNSASMHFGEYGDITVDSNGYGENNLIKLQLDRYNSYYFCEYDGACRDVDDNCTWISNSGTITLKNMSGEGYLRIDSVTASASPASPGTTITITVNTTNTGATDQVDIVGLVNNVIVFDKCYDGCNNNLDTNQTWTESFTFTKSSVDDIITIKTWHLEAGTNSWKLDEDKAITVTTSSTVNYYYQCENNVCNQKTGTGTSDCTPGEPCDSGGDGNNTCHGKIICNVPDNYVYAGAGIIGFLLLVIAIRK